MLDATGSGSVSSINVAVPAPLSSSGGPVTSSGTITLTWTAGQAANRVLATPNGTTGAVSLRTLVAGDLPANLITDAITFVIGGGGVAIVTGVVGDLVIPFNCTITQVTMLADQSTTTVVDIWKQVYASFPPTVANTITASAIPTISATTKSQDSTLTGWTTSITAGDVLRFNVNANNNAKLITIALRVSRT